MNTNITLWQKKIDKIRSPLGAIWFAVELYEESYKGNMESTLVDHLWQNWHKLIEYNNLTDLANRQAGYVIHLARHSSGLIFEEVYKLVSVLEGICVLQQRGIMLDKVKEIELQTATKDVFERYPSDARIATKQLRREWNEDWWYNLLV